MSSIWALQDAKNRFSAVVDRACEVEPQIVTRRGIPVAVLVSYKHFQAESPKTPSFVDVLLGGPKFDDGFAVKRDRSPLRKTEFS